MNQWLASLEQMARYLLGNPASTFELGVLAGVSFLVFLFVLKKSNSAFGVSNTGFLCVLIVALAGILLVLIALTAAKLYTPWWNMAPYRLWMLLGTGVLASLFLVVPLMCAIQRTGYINALLAWICSVAAMAMVIALLGGAFDMLASGAKGAEKGYEHKRQVENILGQ